MSGELKEMGVGLVDKTARGLRAGVDVSVAIETRASSACMLYIFLYIDCIQYTLRYTFCLFFFICRVVRLTSPNLNYLIIAGALLLYASIVFIVTPTLEEETATIYCNVSVVMEPLLPQARASIL